MLRLVIEDDQGKTTIVPLIRDEITIGRKSGNTIRLTERNVSRRHARLLRASNGEDHSIIVEDLDSYNGIMLNGDHVTSKCTMRPGDLIQIGDYSLALQLDQPDLQMGDLDAAGPATIEDVPEALHASLDEVATQVSRVDADALPEDEQARLVVVSSNLAGDSYQVDMREVIIGRTDENDIIVNHRSISRNHAKIVVRNRGFTIIDLASSNGVKVNGSEFGTAGLVNGDIIELGHVRLRFVGPGEDYVFSAADVEDVELEPAVGTGRLLLLAIGLVVVAVITFLVFRKPPDEPVDEHGGLTQEQPKTPVAEPPQAPETPEIPNPEYERLIKEARALMQNEKWDAAADALEGALQSKPRDPDATSMLNEVRREAAAYSAFVELTELVRESRWLDALDRYEAFPKGNKYLGQVDATMRDKIRFGYANAELDRAKEFLDLKNIEGAKGILEDLQKRDYSKAQAEQLAQAIAKAEERLKTAAVIPPPKQPKKDPPPKDVAEPPPSKQVETVDELSEQAVTLQVEGRRREALPIYLRIIKVDPGHVVSYQRLCSIYPNVEPVQGISKALPYCKKWLSLATTDKARALATKQINDYQKKLGE